MPSQSRWRRAEGHAWHERGARAGWPGSPGAWGDALPVGPSARDRRASGHRRGGRPRHALHHRRSPGAGAAGAPGILRAGAGRRARGLPTRVHDIWRAGRGPEQRDPRAHLVQRPRRALASPPGPRRNDRYYGRLRHRGRVAGLRGLLVAHDEWDGGRAPVSGDHRRGHGRDFVSACERTPGPLRARSRGRLFPGGAPGVGVDGRAPGACPEGGRPGRQSRDRISTSGPCGTCWRT
jgi:hypothetical protein